MEEELERGLDKVTDDYEVTIKELMDSGVSGTTLEKIRKKVSDYKDLQKMIDELKTMHRQLLPPVRIERGYEIDGLEIVDILQDMALEDESGASKK